ncbi:MAG TPA: hypothetical protein VKE41_11135 [Roseiflexaceae bacterium]|nr:hypothetical protein [Roseiflexaceae bacterium]
MSITLDQVVPWGRSLDEYRRMFDMSERDLSVKILGCGDGPASFNAEMTALGRSVVSCDPIYAFSKEQIAQRVEETYDPIVEQVRQKAENYVWSDFRDPDDLGRHRLATMRAFLADFDAGRAAGRYLPDALPSLSFAERQFDLALCSHLLFLYSEQLSLDFHQAAIRELCRVAREVRIFPLLALDCRPSTYIQPIQVRLLEAGLVAKLVRVPYEFQAGGDHMMRISRISENF